MPLPNKISLGFGFSTGTSEGGSISVSAGYFSSIALGRSVPGSMLSFVILNWVHVLRYIRDQSKAVDCWLSRIKSFKEPENRSSIHGN